MLFRFYFHEIKIISPEGHGMKFVFYLKKKMYCDEFFFLRNASQYILPDYV